MPSPFAEAALRAMLHLQRHRHLSANWLIEQGLAGIAVLCAPDLQLTDGEQDRLNAWSSAYSAQWLVWQTPWRDALEALPQPIVLKGVALCQWLYPEPAMRPVGDLDVLIAANQRAMASDTLRELGYTPELTVDGDLVMTQQRFTLRREGCVPCHLDLHWESSNRSLLAAALPHEQLKTLLRTNSRGLQSTAALLHAAAHLLGHHANNAEAKWLLDIHLIWELMDDLQRVDATTLAVERSLAPILTEALSLCAKVVGTRNTEQALCRLLPHQRQRCAHYLRGEITAIQDFAAQPGIWRKLQYLFQLIFPSRQYMTARGFGASPAGYMKRLASGWRKLRKQRASPQHGKPF